MLLILARHGETVWNEQKRYQGRADSPLNASGKVHARKIGEYLKQYSIETLYSSPLGRALSTAKIIAGMNKCEIIIEPMLKEIDYGIFEGKTYEDIFCKMPKELEKKKKDRYKYRHINGESYREMDEKRIRPFLKRTIKENKASKSPVVVISHSGPTKIILANLLGVKGKKITEIWQPNDCIYFANIPERGKPKVSYVRVDSGIKSEGLLKISDMAKEEKKKE